MLLPSASLWLKARVTLCANGAPKHPQGELSHQQLPPPVDISALTQRLCNTGAPRALRGAQMPSSGLALSKDTHDLLAPTRGFQPRGLAAGRSPRGGRRGCLPHCSLFTPRN